MAERSPTDMLVRRFALALILATGAVAPAAAVEQQSPLYVIVPFGDPGATDPVQTGATLQFATDLSERHVRSAVSTPIDAIEAVGTAPKMCAEYGAEGLLVPQLRFEQSKERNLTGFIPVVGGLVSSSGAFDRSPIRVQLKLFLIDCSGSIRWKTYTTANKIHKGQNVSAGMTEIANQAMSLAVDQFVNRPARWPYPDR
ncbi:MAG: hypothetical protein NVS3B7_12070 [Candidatus Elarobacter sp.]